LGRPCGQHFLRDEKLLERIADLCAPNGIESRMVEIGPGQGALTRHLLSRCAALTAIEVDTRMVESLRHSFADDPRLEILHANILEVDIGALGPCPVVGNLPYYITSPILSHLFAHTGAWTRAVFLVQREVAERMTASPGTRDYGYLTVQVSLYCHARLVVHVPPAAFRPPPKVDSAVVLLEPKAVDPPAAKSLLELASRAFAHKRKTLRNNLAPYFGKAAIEAQPEAGLRAEQLSLEQFRDLRQRLLSASRMLS
jgi:16S rRNA (adenine1518-N6/adenine1519-N6)-dimethyltransferase